MTPSDLVEKVARAIEAQHGYMGDPARRIARSAILAVLEGLRVPSEAMQDAYQDTASTWDGPMAAILQVEAYTAMIDALSSSLEE